MSSATNDLANFLEAVDSGVLSGEEIERNLKEIAQPKKRRAVEAGIQLLNVLNAMQPNRSDARSSSTLPLGRETSGIEMLGKGVLIGRYELQEELGRGGCGAVFRATDTLLQRNVAIKVPAIMVLDDEDAHRRFLTEARSAAMLKHRNIAGIHDSGTDGGVWYIASEYCSGPTLAEVIENPELLAAPNVEVSDKTEADATRSDDTTADDPASDHSRKKRLVEPRQTARLVAELADGVQHAHDRGVLHRDIKPTNVLVERCDRRSTAEKAAYTPKLIDFGLAKILVDQDAAVTATGARVGTIVYMAPEQVDAETERIDRCTDIYGLGNLLYELLTGEAPFGRSGNLQTLNAIKHRSPRRPRFLNPDVPSVLEAIVMRCLEKRPEDRFASAGDLSEALHGWLNGQQSAKSGIASAGSWPTRRRNQIRASLLGIGALLGALAIVGGIALLPDAAQPPDETAGASSVIEVDPLVDLRRDLVTYLPLTHDLDDASGSGIHARIGGGDPEFTDTAGPAIELDGDGDYLRLDYPEQLQFGEQTSFSVAGWVYLNGDQRHISKNNSWAFRTDVALISSHKMAYRLPGVTAGPIRSEDSTETTGWGMEIRGGNSIRLIAANGDRYQASDLQRISSDRWTFWCMIFDRELGEMTIWTGGKEQGQLPIPPGSIDSINNGYAINIGRDGSGKGERFFQGRVRDLAIWRRALRDHETIALREAGMEATRELLVSEAPN